MRERASLLGKCLLLLVVLGVALLVFLSDLSSFGRASSVFPEAAQGWDVPELDAPHIHDEGEVDNEKESRTRISSLARSSTLGQVTLLGRIQSARDKRPVEAWVAFGDCGGRSSKATGEFCFAATVLPGTTELVVTASGFEALAVRLNLPESPSVDCGDIELRDLSVSEVIVLHSGGRPAKGIEVYVVPVGRPSLSAGSALLAGRTDGDGRLVVGASEDCFVYAVGQDAASALVRLNAREQTLVPLPAISSRVGLRNLNSRQPIVKQPCTAELQGVYPPPSFSFTTDPRGLADRLLPMGNYLIDAVPPSLRFPASELLVGSAHLNRGLAGNAVEVDSESAEVWLDVEELPSLEFDVVDASSGQPLPLAAAWLEVWEDPPFVDRSQWMSLLAQGLRADVFGRVRLHPVSAMLETPGVRKRIVVHEPGHFSCVLDEAVIAEILRGSVPKVPMEEAKGVAIVLKNASRDRLRRTVYAYPEGRPYQSIEIPPSALGSASLARPPRGTEGVDTLLFAAGEGPAVEPVGSLLLDGTELPMEHQVTLDLDSSIEVELPGDESWKRTPVSCLSRDGVEYSGWLSEGRLVFGQLPPGRYAVGVPEFLSEAWALDANAQSPFSIQLGSGETRTVAWDDRWRDGQEDVSGAVEVQRYHAELGGPLVAVARWTPASMAIAGGSMRTRVPLKIDGTYRFRGLHQLPEYVLVGRIRDGGDILPLGWGAPDRLIEIPSGRVVVNLPEGLVDAILEVVPRVRDASSGRPFRFRELGQRTIDLGLLPLETRELVVRTSSREERIELHLVEGETTIVDVE